MEHRPATGVDVTDDEVDPSHLGVNAGNAHPHPTGVSIAVDTAATADDSTIEAVVPDGATLTAEAVRLAGDDRDLAHLVETYWRFAPDEELVDLSPGAMLAAVRAHRRLAEQRLP